MSHTARFVLKIIAAGLGLAAILCLTLGAWEDVKAGCCGVKHRLAKKFGSEYDDYNDEELYDE